MNLAQRIYARYIIYMLMNNEDFKIQVAHLMYVKKSLTIKTSKHKSEVVAGAIING